MPLPRPAPPRFALLKNRTRPVPVNTRPYPPLPAGLWPVCPPLPSSSGAVPTAEASNSQPPTPSLPGALPSCEAPPDRP
ncbi:hypothetical protein EV2_010899 [Malus domestica]